MASATAPAAPFPMPGPREEIAQKQREELAMLEGHDADIPTETQPLSVHNGSAARESSDSAADTDKDVEKGRTYPSGQGEDGPRKEETTASDPNIVDWDGPEDPYNPLNWKSSLKWGSVATISSITFITYVLLHGRLLSLEVPIDARMLPRSMFWDL